MRFVSTQEFCAHPNVMPEGDVVLTVDGAAVGMVIALRGEEDPDELARLIRRARAETAVRRIRERAISLGLDTLTIEEIDGEIAAARAERRS
jgi:hypothetical protein